MLASIPNMSDPGEDGRIVVRLNELMARRRITGRQLAAQVGINEVNLSLLRTGKVRGVKFETLAKLCRLLGCQPGDLLDYEPGAEEPRER